MAKTKELEQSTHRAYASWVNKHIVPFLGAAKLTAVTTPLVYKFADDLKADGRTAETIRRAVQTLGFLIKHARGRGLVATNPVADVRLPSSKRGKKRPVMPTKAELRAILENADDRWRPLIFTAAFSGLRASELRGLPWRCVDLKGAKLTVEQRADAWKVIGVPKSASGLRDVPLPPIVINMLREWRLACPKGELDLVFPNGAGNVEDLANIVERGWFPAQVAAGVTKTTLRKNAEGERVPTMIGKYNFHTLRHAAAALFIEQGWSPKRVQVAMGHASISTTYDLYGYLFVDAEDDKRSMAEIESRLLG